MHDLLVSSSGYRARTHLGVASGGEFYGLTLVAGMKLLANALPKGFGQVDTLGKGKSHQLFGQLWYCHALMLHSTTE